MILEIVRVGQFEANCYILAKGAGSEAIIIDPGAEGEKIERVLNKHNLKPALVINTHGHFDHIGCDDKFGVPVYIHSDDAAFLNDPKLNLSNFMALAYRVKSVIKMLEDREKIKLDGIELEVIHTPGHTPGGICLLLKKPVSNILFSGDTLFFQGIGRTDFAGASQSSLLASIKEKLLVLVDETQVYPGHGSSTTIGEEKNNNSFLI
jgi:hydroxyacylglutathione hydrolase